MPQLPQDNVAVVGTGAMGSQIAMLCALAGLDTAVTDVCTDALDRARAQLRRRIDCDVAKGRRCRNDVDAAFARLSFGTDLDAAAGAADLVIEAALEDLEVKRELFARLDKAAPPHAILTTNSSAIMSSQLADVTRRPDRVANMHVFNPALVMRCVEVVRSPATSDAWLHHSKHHAAYVKGANDTIDALAELREQERIPPAALIGLEKSLAFNLSGHILHVIFWTNLTPGGGGEPDGELGAAIDEHFGSFAAFKRQLHTATVSVQGSGWGVLGWEPTGQRLVVQQVYDHHGNVGIGAVPLLVFDAWEHAYYLQYRNVRPDYVTKLWDIVDWANVTQRFAAARNG